MQKQQYTENLQDTLFALKNSQQRESQYRQESDAILSALPALFGAASRAEVQATLKKIFQQLLNCENCWVLHLENDRLTTDNNLSFPVYQSFSRVLNGDALNAFDVKQIPEWRDSNNKNNNIRSALHLPLKLATKQGMLIISSSKTAAFSNQSSKLAQRIIPLTEQATAKIEQIELAHATEMQQQWKLMRLIMDHAPIGMFMISKQHKTLFANREFCEKVGISESKLTKAERYSEVLPQSLAAKCMASDIRCFEQGKTITSRNTISSADGSEQIVDTIKVPVHDACGEIYALVGICVDITKRIELEQEKEHLHTQLLHTQKLESLGVLAGGIAHDFNNILAAVMGHASLASNKYKSDPAAVKQHLNKIVLASEKAADLCKQMLAYSGQGKVFVDWIDLSTLIKDMLNILEVSLNKGIILKLSLTENLPLVEADASQLQQVIMNLITNANEAIDDISGIIAIRTGVMSANNDYLESCLCSEDIQPGHFIFMEVSDTGCGMDRETIKKIFDPFFSTKFIGRGLGMSAVLGIIRSHQGALKIYSEPKTGTTFRVLLPVATSQREKTDENMENQLHASGIRSVLVVDDEESMREIAVMMLEDTGIVTVFTAVDGRDAIDVYQREAENIDLIILDLTMPHMGGEEAFRQLRIINPDVNVVIASGYSQQSVQDLFAGKGLSGFLQKPFTQEQLYEVLKESVANKP